jgi:hypothetical protein
MHPTKKFWDKTKKYLDLLEPFSYSETRQILLENSLYLNYFGKAKNRTLIKENPKLYKSILIHTEELEKIFKIQKTYKSSYNLSHRIKFIVELDRDIELLKCECGKNYNWSKYCRSCPEPRKTWAGKKHTEETRKKMRLSTLEYLENLKGQLAPRYNKQSIQIIEKYGKSETIHV